MLKYVLKRVGLMVMTFAAIMLICFVLIKALPIVINIQIGVDAERVRRVYEARGYYKPILEQLFLYLQRIVVNGDWGVGINLYEGTKVMSTFLEMLPATMLLNVYSMLISIPIGFALGIYAALKKNKWQDHAVSTGVMVFISVPSFVYAFLLQYILCFRLDLLPLTMKGGTDWLSFEMFLSVLTPVLALSFGTIASFTRYTRAELTEVLTNDFMLLARTKGLTRRQATLRHALRNSMVPIFPMIIGQFIGILQGSLVVEAVFGVPGVGGLLIKAINAQDVDYFMLLSAFYVFISLFAGILVDISYGFIDPRIRMGAAK